MRVYDGGDLFTSRQLAGEGRALAADSDAHRGVLNVRLQDKLQTGRALLLWSIAIQAKDCYRANSRAWF